MGLLKSSHPKLPGSFLLVAALLLYGCGGSTNQPFPGGFGNALPEASTTGSGGSEGLSSGMSIISSNTFDLASSSDGILGPVYDGTRLLMSEYNPVVLLSSGTLTFNYLGLSTLVLQTTSSSTYSGDIRQINQVFNGPSAGQTALFWQGAGGNSLLGNLSIRENSDGAVLSTLPINLSNYGCTSGGPLTFCNGNYYGACTASGSLRLYSFSTSGTMQSGVTTSSSTGNLNALTCYNNAYLILVTSTCTGNSLHTCFFKFDLSFDLTTSDTSSASSFPVGLQGINGIATDGDYLYLGGEIDMSQVPFKYTVGTATLGGLQ